MTREQSGALYELAPNKAVAAVPRISELFFDMLSSLLEMIPTGAVWQSTLAWLQYTRLACSFRQNQVALFKALPP
jgi:hypothetical protein